MIEAVVGLVIHSLSLLSDAGHNLADVASLGLSLFAFRMMKVKSNTVYTYGYKKTTVLVALLNGGILLISIGAILYESVHRLILPEPLARQNHFHRCSHWYSDQCIHCPLIFPQQRFGSEY